MVIRWIIHNLENSQNYSKANYNCYIEISKYGQLKAGNIFILGGPAALNRLTSGRAI